MPNTYSDTTIVADAPSSSVAWPAIIAGAIGAVTLTSLLFPLGAALGFAAPWSAGAENAAKGLTIASVVWLIVVQWLSSGVGGYLTGRLRNKVIGAHQHEVFFRDTAHGFLSWGIGTMIMGILIALLAAPAMDYQASRYGYGQDNVRAQATATVNNPARLAQRNAPAPVATPEEERKAAAKASLFLFLTMLIGAFVSTTAAALGGRHRDIHFALGRLRE